MDHFTPCKKVIEVSEKVAALGEVTKSTRSWVNDIDKETTSLHGRINNIDDKFSARLDKLEIKITTVIAIAVFASNIVALYLSKYIDKLFTVSLYYLEGLIDLIPPSVSAGTF